jgi:hypothetical protein
MLGLLEDVTKHCRPGLTNEGDELFLLGAALEQPPAALAASEYLKLEHGLIGGRLEIDLDLEARVQRAALAAVRQGLATACHDCSDGGLAVALAEMCLGRTCGGSSWTFGADLAWTRRCSKRSRASWWRCPGGARSSGDSRGLNVQVSFVGQPTATGCVCGR